MGLTGIIICRGRGQRKQKCDFCPATTASPYLCDSPVIRDGKRGTCDKKMCNACARPIGQAADDNDLCPPHFRAWEANGRRFAL